MNSFSTEELPPHKKLPAWNAFMHRIFPQMEIQAGNVRQFDASARVARSGAIDLAYVRCAAAQTVNVGDRTAAGANRSRYAILVPLKGEVELEFGRSSSRLRVRSGDLCMVDLGSSFSVVHGDSTRLLSVHLPRRVLDARLPGIGRLAGQPMTSDNALSRALVVMLHQLGRDISEATVESYPDPFGSALLDFVAACYVSTVERQPIGRGVRARAAAFCAFIDTRFTDPQLAPMHVAHHFEVSERYLRAVLHAQGESFGVYLMRRRLARCAERLEDCEDQSTIMQVAFEAGFNNATHFAEVFKKHFGTTPREYRKGVRRQNN